MKPQQVQQVLALEGFLDRHDQFLRASKAQYLTYADTIENLDFQADLVKQALNAKRWWRAELATGIGKSVIAARIACERLHDGPTIYISPSAASIGDLEGGVINKFNRTFAAFGRGNAELGAVNDLSRANDVSFMTPRVFVSLLQREPKYVRDMLKRAACFIVDEAHHFPDDEDGDLRVFGELYDAADQYVRDGLTVAMTGTWERLDRKRVMGCEKPDARLTVQDAVNLKRCPELYGVQVITDVRAKDVSCRADLYDFHLTGEERIAYLTSVVDCMHAVWRRYPVPFAAFARTVQDATVLVAQFNAKAGLDAARGLVVLTSTTPLHVRKQVVRDLIARRRIGYVTCAVGEEALDVPPLEVVHLIRRTRSRARNGQAVGRALRVWDGKRRALVIDYQTMLEGIQDKFLGLSCDDLLAHCGSDVAPGRCVNGGPLVCQQIPQGELVGMTMGEERAVVCINVSSKESNMRELRQLARACAPRPHYKTTLGRALVNYTARGSAIYDGVFAMELWALCPAWEHDPHRAQDKKQQLLKLAKDKKPRPRDGVLGRAVKRYLMPSSKSYDQAFAEEIERLCPDWVHERTASSITAYKARLIEQARNNVRRPSGQEWNRLRCLMRTDATFRFAIAEARPEWLKPRTVRGDQLKAELKQAAQVPNAPRPFGLLDEALLRYCRRTGSSAYDSKLRADLERLQPEWFVLSSAIVKRELLAMARREESRPALRSTKESQQLYWKLWGYTRYGHKTYDADFTAELFSIRPDWRFQRHLKREEAAPLKCVEDALPLQRVKDALLSLRERVIENWTCRCGCPNWQTHRRLQEKRAA